MKSLRLKMHRKTLDGIKVTRIRVRFPELPDFLSSGSGTLERGTHSLVITIAEQLGTKISGSGL
jgi:hypothetical protein